jgi:hypothetical protein
VLSVRSGSAVVCPRNSAAISICYCMMVVTSLDCFVVVVGGSSCSI